MWKKIEKNEGLDKYKNFDVYTLNKKVNSIYNRIFKRLFDLIIAIILFILLLPVFLFISILIILDSGFPVFYKAYRGGFNDKPFKIYKFRTMIKNADKIGGGTTALNDSRITRIGKILRKTKLDEIPQLINIIKGEMSFIGPRPELLKYTSQYDNIEKYILKVRPGITDFSSLEFINLDEIVGDKNADEVYEKYVLPKKNYLRLKYVEQMSLLVDTKLFFKTIIKTFRNALKVIYNRRGNNGKNYT
jgi:lipopolysaccharide/colanic/teichoic acid biosynthesis glycosyltransferase